ncbi:CapA family protein [Marivirga sp. S37H4]|uniref:CapA family protein n=1 Tax=Marivirga aurantiaca TaxID=2802615 RepID=A0A934WV64_9BACT|nr:CapA family protein [Marivirga aurantiaca]MBK6263567.1 CapA family protein [Marivirga aurantiaca]
MLRNFFTFLVISISFVACKTVQKSSQTDDQSATAATEHQKNDSLSSTQTDSTLIAVDSSLLQDSVKISMHPVKKDTLHIIGVGDIMIGTNFPNSSYLPIDSGKHMLADVKPVLLDADLTFGNQEGVILNEGGTQKNCSNPDLCYLFRSPEYLVQHYVDAGFDLMSLANNHAGDFGDEGRKNTMRVLDSLGIHHSGQLTHPFTIFEKENITYGFVSFSPNYGTQSINNIPEAVGIVKHLDSLSDIVIVSFHGGAEGKKFQHVTRETEEFYGENRGNVYKFSHEVIDAGADIVFGHGPHVARAIEVYKNRFIAYSLGNFATYGRFNLSGESGLAPIVKIQVDSKGVFIEGKIISAIQVGGGIPTIDPQHRAALKIKELTESDFPESKILIDLEGNIRYLHDQY